MWDRVHSKDLGACLTPAAQILGSRPQCNSFQVRFRASIIYSIPKSRRRIGNLCIRNKFSSVLELCKAYLGGIRFRLGVRK